MLVLLSGGAIRFSASGGALLLLKIETGVVCRRRRLGQLFGSLFQAHVEAGGDGVEFRWRDDGGFNPSGL